jgi:hypothetical protein
LLFLESVAALRPLQKKSARRKRWRCLVITAAPHELCHRASHGYKVIIAG